MKKVFCILMMMPLVVGLNSCGSLLKTPSNTDPGATTTENQITWGEMTGNFNDLWSFVSNQSYATSNNALAQALLPVLIELLNKTPAAEAYLFNADKSYSQFWTSNQPNDPETGLFKESGTYVLKDRDLTFTYKDGQTGETKTEVYKIVSLSATQLVLYKDVLGIWGELGASIVGPFDKIGAMPKSAYKIITYSRYVAE